MMMAKEVSRQLAQRAEDIARYLLPNGKKEGNEWRIGSADGETGQSLGVRLSGEKSGIWCDFAKGDSGDLLDLWAAARNLRLSEAIKEATHYLGMDLPQFEAYKSSNFVKPEPKVIAELKMSSPVMSYLINERKLTTETITAYQIGERSRQIVFPYLRDGELIFAKYLGLDRTNNKKQIAVEPNCEPCLFGWHLIPTNARTVTLCEGEIDAMTLYQYGFPALSVPFGGGGGKKHQWLEYEFERLAIFDEIYLCFDDDEQGQLASRELVERLGRHRCRIVKLPMKDANECLKKNMSRETICSCFIESLTLDPNELKSAHHFVDQVIDGFYPKPGVHLGYNAPWAKTQGKIIFRSNELSVWTGINGHGKSQFLGQIILHSMKQGARVCIASLELKPQRLLMRLTRQAGGLAQPSEDYIRAIHDWYGDKLWLFDLVGTTKVDRLLEVFLYARQRYGIDVFVIDSFMKCGIAEDDYNAQKAFIDKLCDFKNQHNCHVHLIMHPRKTDDEMKMPGKLDVKGTGATTDLADNCFVVWRNKAKEELVQLQSSGRELDTKQLAKLDECDSLWRCDKQRNGEWEGKVALWFDRQSFQYLENSRHPPKRFVEYSSRQSIGTA